MLVQPSMKSSSVKPDGQWTAATPSEAASLTSRQQSSKKRMLES
eukprot:CAMPEP_0183368268 /NCGR_PEP_ID=MMETSP0164_2-20130417/95272_1 /TAXON_ID=221442 /ORGANISM="Coccolithus pelagicus ssp braarudi, Strain PLY182g" /LENGTH=43 /DNA_ID= /DNA_START= /DNA_END= /DNA_ORIENTATION=